MKAVLLEQNIFASITPASLGVVKMLAAIQFNCYLGICSQQANLNLTEEL